MIFTLNGQHKEILLKNNNIQDLLSSLNVNDNRGVAVALNDSVVPKSEWEKTEINENDRVEIISPFQGG